VRQRVSTPFLRAETPLKHENQKFDQKFDFEERGYFGITRVAATESSSDSEAAIVIVQQQVVVVVSSCDDE
jgi:hypothetical protein